MTLIFDTETTDLPLWSEKHDHPNQGRICQLAMILIDKDHQEVGAFSTYIKPDGWRMSVGAQARHNIDISVCEKYGIFIKDALHIFDSYMAKASVVVAHGLKFDSFLIDTECVLLQKPFKYNWFQQGYCTMLKSTPVCKLTQSPTDKRRKWPKLSELHEFLFGAGFDNQHDALADCRATKKCYIKLKEMGI